MNIFTEETIDTIIKIGGNGTLNHLKPNRTLTILLYSTHQNKTIKRLWI